MTRPRHEAGSRQSGVLLQSRPTVIAQKYAHYGICQEAIDRLLHRAALANRLAKTSTSRRDRDRFYTIKAEALIRLLECGEAEIQHIDRVRNLLWLRLSNGCCPHLPIACLPAHILEYVSLVAKQTFAA